MLAEYERYMRLALNQAELAAAAGEVPVGALIVSESGDVLAQAHNRPVCSHDPTLHAEVAVIREAAMKAGNYRLTGTTLYVTIEPCCMCAGAMLHARISRVVFGAWDEKAGACGSVYDIVRDKRLNHRLEVVSGVLGQECSRILKDFFRQKRLEKGMSGRKI